MRTKSDQATRYAAKLDPVEFLRWLLRGMDPDLRFARWLDTRRLPFPGEPDRVCDTVAELEHVSGTAPPWALVVEFQSQPEPEMSERLLEYAIRARRELRHGPHGRDKYFVAAAVINLTEVSRTDPLEMAFPGVNHLRLSWGVVVRNLETEGAAATLSAIEAGQTARCVLPWIPLMAGGEQEAIIKEWKRVASLETDERSRKRYAGLALVFADRAGRKESWQQALEEWNVKELSIIEEWQEEARVETRRDDLLRLLRSKFAGAVTPQLFQTIHAQTSSKDLSHWFDLALAASSLEQFLTILGLGKDGAAPG
jgi:hypothetical protein